MSDNEPTYKKSGNANPYEYYNPYSGQPDMPPPPPKVKHPIKWRIVVICAFIVVLVAASLIGVFTLASHTYTSVQVTPTKVPSVIPTTATTQIPTQQYSVSTIVQDFLADNLPVVQPNYSQNLNTFVGKQVTNVSTQSEVSFIDPTLCNGPCDVGGAWLGVYNSLTDAETADNDVKNFNIYNSNTPYVLTASQHGRCILVGQPPTSAYVLVINTVCT